MEEVEAPLRHLVALAHGDEDAPLAGEQVVPQVQQGQLAALYVCSQPEYRTMKATIVL